MKIAQHLRLLWIDAHAAQYGYINRSDLCDAWDISLPQASKDLTLLASKYPSRYKYDLRQKTYIFRPTKRGPKATPEIKALLKTLTANL